MNDNFENNNQPEYGGTPQNSSSYRPETPEAAQSNAYSSSDPSVGSESSYEWNGAQAQTDYSAQGAQESGEYHYSYINGNNKNARHNPNRYESAYSSSAAGQSGGYSSQPDPYASSQGYSHYYGAQNGAQQPQGSAAYGDQSYANVAGTRDKSKHKKPKKQRKPASKGFVAAIVAAAIVLGGAAGFGGSVLANSLNLSTGSSSSGVNITQVSADSTSSSTTTSSAAISGTTSEIVKKTADSVVEIATESVVTGGFAQQYVQTGAGSGVIISEDGYIITNQHVIDGAKTITVTLRDGSTSYTATLVGSDETNDIALLKIDATGLSLATFGDSSSLVVGDYVVAIGNPLGTLGGTVTDGIISALARQVTIDDQSMTLLQHSAQISPGNSGGGLFNANGELIGIVNAKDSATSVEGIAFAIPINNVLDILDDLKNYGYVTGQVDLGMELTDITSSDSAFYYGLSTTGCYVLSVTSGSNAEEAGFKSGDLITAVNGTSVSSKSDVTTAIADCSVGDTVTFTVTRSGRTADLELTLAEYAPSGSSSSGSSQTSSQTSSNSDDSIWSYMFG